MSEKPYADIGFIIPLAEEFDGLERVFPRLEQYVDGVQFHTKIDLGRNDLSAVAFLQDDMGKSASARAADRMFASYDIGIVIVLGIAGGLSSDASIGDICFSGTIIDVLENAKIGEDKKSQKAKYTPKFLSTDPRLSFALKYVKLGSDTRSAFEHWQLEQYYLARSDVPGPFVGKDSANEEIAIPDAHEGNIACGAVSKSELYKTDFHNIDRKILAIETESGGSFHSAALAGVPAVTIRGICDYADSNKNKFEKQTNGKARSIAARNAASFVKLQLTNPQFLSYLASARQTRLQFAPPSLVGNDIDSALSETRETIHQHLTELSPEYKGKPKGYRLPLPRMKLSSSASKVSPREKSADPVSVLEAITSHRIILTNVPRNYPDNSLPWVIAAELSLISIGGKQALPIVIQGDRIKPPNDTIIDQCSQSIAKTLRQKNVMPVFLLTEFPMESRSRIDYLKKQIEAHADARFVIVNKAEPNLPSNIDLVLTLGAELFEVCDISFAEISEFLQRAFEMPDIEAGVVALRLQKMFKQFELPAHPSFFAGVAGEVLTSLLRANRRAELIQLAVGGFLSFVVATDKASVVLSRTTREEFLRHLAFEKNVEKRNFSQSDLVEFARAFAASRDYEIDPLTFIASFKDKGILHFENDRAVISLPFIESYLLASELSKRPADAARYFVVSANDFDHPTFDLYSEIEPSKQIVDSVLQGAENAIADLSSNASATHILLTNEINPPILQKAGRLPALQERLERAFDDVRNNRSRSGEKQRLLDIATKVEDTARDQRKKAHEKARVDNEGWERVEAAAQVWGISIILLGSGSERLDRESKRALALRIVQLASILLDQIIRAFPKAEFGVFKDEMLSEESIRQNLNVSEEEDIEGTIEFVRAILEAYEFQLVGYPVRVFLDYLGNSAGQPVLRPSVASVESKHAIENLIARVWAAEIDASREKASLLTSIKDLPPHSFFRNTLSTFFLTRVFWNHWDRNNRLALLDAATECLAPLSGGQVDKGRLMRIIEKDDDEGSKV